MACSSLAWRGGDGEFGGKEWAVEGEILKNTKICSDIRLLKKTSAHYHGLVTQPSLSFSKIQKVNLYVFFESSRLDVTILTGMCCKF
jgi:hypothetical protein